jgi:hypothetical protein
MKVLDLTLKKKKENTESKKERGGGGAQVVKLEDLSPGFSTAKSEKNINYHRYFHLISSFLSIFIENNVEFSKCFF